MAVPKYGGRDCELSTTGVDPSGAAVDCCLVTSRVLAAMGPALAALGIRTWSRQPSGEGYTCRPASPYAVDSLRHWTAGGQCYYADMGHVEVCTASSLYPTTFAAQCLSTVLSAEAARSLAQSHSDAGHAYRLAASNADTVDPGTSFGTHVSLAVDSRLWEDLFLEQRHPAILGFVSSAVAAAIVFFGAGYLLPLRDGTTIYSLSARAHHLSRLTTLSTTERFARGILNSRREPHGRGHDRLHLIGFDYCLLSSALLFSLLQCVLAAAEEGFCGLNLFDPVRALRLWSWNLDARNGRLPATAPLTDGRQLTLPAYVRELTEALLKMCESGLITPAVAPQTGDMLPRIIELTRYADEGSLTRCARHLTWAAKWLWLTQLAASGATMGDAETRLADHDFSCTEPSVGALWRLWQEGLVDPLVDISAATDCLRAGPAESRDWARGQIIGRFFDRVVDVDWDFVELRSTDGRWNPRLRIELPRPDSLRRDRFGHIIQAAEHPRQLGELLAEQSEPYARPSDPLHDVSRQLALPDEPPRGTRQ
jgi:hypothetical protein